MGGLALLSEHAAESYILGGLSEVESHEFESHLPYCPECTKELTILAAFERDVRAVTLEQAPAKSKLAVDRKQLMTRYHELVDRKLVGRLNRKEAAELRALGKKLDSQEDPRFIREFESSLHRDRELLRKSINEILVVARQLSAK